MIDLLNNKELFIHLLTNGIKVTKNIDLFNSDKEFYFKDLSKSISEDLPFMFSWYCDKTESLVMEIENYKEFGRISYENDNILFFKGRDFEQYSPMFLMSCIIAVLKFEELIQMPNFDNEDVEEDTEEDSDSIPEWL